MNKVASGNSLYDYLVSGLWFEKRVLTRVIHRPMDSASNKGVQFADMLSGAIQHHFEDKKSIPFLLLNKHVVAKQLYFPQKINEYTNCEEIRHA